MTWVEFNDAVNELLTVDADRLGAETYVEQQIRQAVLNLQSYVPAYRNGMQSNYEPADLTQNGLASQGTLPASEFDFDDGYILRYKTLTIASVDAGTDTLTVTAHGLTTGDFVSVRVATGGTMPGGLTAGALYYARSTGVNTLTLHRTADPEDDTLLINITSTGSGALSLDYSQQRHPLHEHGWKDRHELTTGEMCINDNSGRIAFDPHGNTFLVVPGVVALDGDGFSYRLELNWTGVKLEWEDDDETPFDEMMTQVVADYVTARVARKVERDEKRYESFMLSFNQGRQMLYLDKR